MTSRKFTRIAIPTALVVGGLTAGSFLAPIGLAGAQEGDTTDPAPGAGESDGGAGRAKEGRSSRGHRHERMMAKVEVLEEVLGLDGAEIRDAMVDGKTLADLATEQGVSEDDLVAALVTAATERIDEAVADGKLDEDRAAEIRDGLDERIAEMITMPPPDRGDRGPGRGHHPGHGFPAGVLAPASEAAQEALGLTGEEIRAGLADGETLADLATEQGVSEDDLVAALVAAVTERIDGAVADGKLDEDRADEARAELADMIDRAVSAEPFDLGRWIGRAESHRRGHHHRPDTTADDDTTADAEPGEAVDASF